MGFGKSGYTTEAGGGQQEWHSGPEMQEEALSRVCVGKKERGGGLSYLKPFDTQAM